MRVLIAADSFKEALPAQDVCAAIAAGLSQHDTVQFPLADGGEGTLDVLAMHLGLSKFAADVNDPLRRPTRAHFGVAPDHKTAYVELAQASGLQLLHASERNPLETTTFGTGQLIAAAISFGAERIVLAIGGSATHDGGIGIAAALGWRYLNQNGEDVAPTGKALGEIKQAVRPSRSLPRFDVLCDVTNPLFGASGAAQVYARQKGADDAAVTRLDDGLRHLAQLVERQRLSTLSPATPGAGAAGGVGYGAVAFLNAQLHRGIEHLLDLTHFDAALNQADVVITGEGRLDAQTLQGKLIDGVCRRAQRAGKPVLALCGELHATNDELRRIGLHAAYCINDGLPTEDALQKTAERLARATERLELPSPQPSPRTGRG